MKTEINGDFKGYVTRFKMPSLNCFIYPLKSAGIIFIIQLVLSGLFYAIGTSKATFFILLMQVLLMIGYYIGVHYKQFWNVVLEESKGLFADLLMWLYYIIICVISLMPSFIYFYIAESSLLG